LAEKEGQSEEIYEKNPLTSEEKKRNTRTARAQKGEKRMGFGRMKDAGSERGAYRGALGC